MIIKNRLTRQLLDTLQSLRLYSQQIGFINSERTNSIISHSQKTDYDTEATVSPLPKDRLSLSELETKSSIKSQYLLKAVRSGTLYLKSILRVCE